MPSHRKERALSVHARMILWSLFEDGNVVQRKNTTKGPAASTVLYERIAERCRALGLKPQVRNNFRTMMGSLARADKVEVSSFGNRTYAIKLLADESQLGTNPFDPDTVMPTKPWQIKNAVTPLTGPSAAKPCTPQIGPLNEIMAWPVRRRAEALAMIAVSIETDLKSL